MENKELTLELVSNSLKDVYKWNELARVLLKKDKTKQNVIKCKEMFRQLFTDKEFLCVILDDLLDKTINHNS